MNKTRNTKQSSIAVTPSGEIIEYENEKYTYTEVLRQKCAVFYKTMSSEGEEGTAILDCKKNTLTINYLTEEGKYTDGVLYNVGKGKYRGTRIIEGTGITSLYEVQFC